MQEPPIRSRRRTSYLKIALLVAGAGTLFSSCATQKQQTALISDPDAHNESSIPWNKPAKWENGANVPGGIGSGMGMGGMGDTSINN
jgi:hypothetical protein